MTTEYQDIDLTIEAQVATIAIHPTRLAFADGRSTATAHHELEEVMIRVRQDDTVRVVVLTGAEDGEFFVPPTLEQTSGAFRAVPAGPIYRAVTSVQRLHQTMAEMEKPIVARVNGDAIMFGQTLLFNSDYVVARDNAVIVDTHMAMGEIPPYGLPFCAVPGDGGAALTPLHFSPHLAKEYLMLGRAFTAGELAEMGIINQAVPAAELSAACDTVVERLLARSAHALAWTKRVANRHVVDHLNRTLDASGAYEIVSFYERAAQSARAAEQRS